MPLVTLTVRRLKSSAFKSTVLDTVHAATLDCDGQKWRVAFELLRHLIDVRTARLRSKMRASAFEQMMAERAALFTGLSSRSASIGLDEWEDRRLACLRCTGKTD